MSVIEDILKKKRDEVSKLKRSPGTAALRRRARAADPVRDFGAVLRDGATPRIIAEFKRASPSKGAIRKGADAAVVAREYAVAGAAALSVLTDAEFFGGSLDDLVAARGACNLPVLRKDFTIDPIQLLEARAAGADAVLLIASALEGDRLGELYEAAGELEMAALVEVHTREELDRALEIDAQIVGINNRDLATFETDISVTKKLAPRAKGRIIVSESGIDKPAVLQELAKAGVDAFLVGEVLMRSPTPGEALGRLRGIG